MDVKGFALISGSKGLGATLSLLTAGFFVVSIHACAPRRTILRSPLPPTVRPTPSLPSYELSQPPGRLEPEPGPIVEEARVTEENLSEKRSIPQPTVEGQAPPPTASLPMLPSLPDDSSLIAKITPQTSPQRAASLRLTEEGKRLLESGEHAKALARLERTISIDSTNPYGYYYLARAHHQLGRYQQSLNFLDVAETLLGDDSYWLAEVFALRGENFRALGILQRADSNYSKALRLNPENRLASEGLSRIRGEIPPSPR